MFSSTQHYENSSLREIIIEHQFIGAALKACWCAGVIDAEILRSEFDGYGYDIVLSRGDIVRHVQLKAGLKLKDVGVSELLADKPSGCVIFLQVNDNLDMGPYYWFGSDVGGSLPNIGHLPLLKRTTHNAQGDRPERSRHRKLPKAYFTKLETLEQLLGHLLALQTMQSDVCN